MKKLVLVLLVILLFVGCSDTAAVIVEPSKDTWMNISLDITNSYTFITEIHEGLPPYPADGASVEEWEKYMFEKYGVDITLHDSSEYVQTGFHFRDNASNIMGLASNEKILPLEDYLSESKTWNALPESIRKAYEFNGHIYALPAGNTKATFNSLVFIDTQVLVNLGVEMPTSLDEFTALVQKFAASDKYKGQFLMKSEDLFKLRQIWNAYGTTIPEDSICYNPDADCIQDSLFNLKTVEVLSYLNEIVKAGVVNPSQSSQSSFLYFGDSIADTVQKAAESGIQIEPLPIFEGCILPYSETPSGGYSLFKDTKNPKEATLCLVDLLYGFSDSYLDMNLGLPDHYQIGSDKTVTIKINTTASNGLENNYALPALGGSGILHGMDYTVLTEKQDKKEALNQIKAAKKVETDWMRKNETRLKLVKDYGSQFYPSEEYRQLITPILNVYAERSDIEIALDAYRATASDGELDAGLKKYNESLGLVYQSNIRN